METLAIKSLLQLGGGYVLAAIGFVLFFLERRRNNQLQESKDQLYDRLFDSSESVTTAITEIGGVLREHDRMLDNVVETTKMLSGRR